MGTVTQLKPRPTADETLTREDQVGQLLFEYYPHATFEQLDLAMRHANRVLAVGASLDDAMRVATTIIDPDHNLSQHHQDAIAAYNQALNACRERLQEIAERRICKLLVARPSPVADYAAAVMRAHRSLERGSNLSAAVYQAVKPLMEDPDA